MADRPACVVCAAHGVSTAAAGRWRVPGGCGHVRAWEQDLCLVHERECEPNRGPATMLVDYLPAPAE